MQIHGFVTFLAGPVLHEPGSATFDLYTTSSLLLDMLDISASMTYHLCPQIEPWKRLQIYRNAFFGPFALPKASVKRYGG